MGSLPFRAGASPFHAKGTNYRNLNGFLDERLDGKRADFVAGLRDPELRQFFSQSFLAGSWYDALPMAPMAAEIARELKLPTLQMLRELAHFSLDCDVRGVHRLLLRSVSPERVLERMSNASRQLFDFVTTTHQPRAPRQVHISHAGVPAAVATVFQNLTEGFVEAAIGLAGAKDVLQRWSKEPAGELHGVPLVRLDCDISWH